MGHYEAICKIVQPNDEMVSPRDGVSLVPPKGWVRARKAIRL